MKTVEDPCKCGLPNCAGHEVVEGHYALIRIPCKCCSTFAEWAVNHCPGCNSPHAKNGTCPDCGVTYDLRANIEKWMRIAKSQARASLRTAFTWSVDSVFKSHDHDQGSRSGVQSLDRHKGEPILDEVLALRKWLRERVEDGSQILFPSQKGGMLTRMQLLRIFRKYALTAGVSRELAHPHILRHTLCSVMASQHADVYAIQRRAGHKNVSNTMVYTHTSDRQANESAQEALMTAFA